MSNVPRARELLLDLARMLPGHQRRIIEHIVAAYLVREPRVRRAPVRPKEITPEIKAQVRELAQTDMHQWEIGKRLGINPGRVSEILNGKR